MERLSGLDASFLLMETPASHMHVASLAVFDPSTAPGGWSIERLKEEYGRRLHLAPPFRRRLVEIPFHLHHPLWIEDPEFDLNWHIRHIAVPPPGGPRELADLSAHLVSIQLDRSRPLWEMWVIEGVEGGNVAVLTKVHHAAIDGAAGNELLLATLDLSPDDADVPEPEEPWEPDRIPTELERLSYATASLIRTPPKALAAVRRAVDAARDVRRVRTQPDVTPPPAPFSAPHTSFNQTLTAHRSFAATTLSLQKAKDIKAAAGVKVNDVVLAICAGALRGYLDERRETPDRALVAMVPVSVRADEQRSEMGNRVSSMLCSLATDIDDPVERLQAIAAGTQLAKTQQDAIGADTLRDWAEFAAPGLMGRAVRLYSRTRMADLHRPLFNVTISNVPGPPFKLYTAGAELLALYPLGPIFDGGGLNITVMSYRDNLDFGLLACPDVLPDVWSVADGLAKSLDELAGATT